MVSGQLQLRGADPFALVNPTSISGTNDNGQLSGVVLSTPTVRTVRDVPEYNTTATIDAAFSMVQPGVGTITEAGNMTVQVRLAVDLHIVVPLLEGASDCRAAPINLTLTSTAPYNPDTQRVTLRAATFSVPPIGASPGCNGLLTDPVNEALAGTGHSLTLTMAGAITPPPRGEPTATTLAVTPVGEARFGENVTLTATVVPDPVVEGAPGVSGVVTFLDGGDSIGTAEVQEDGTATLVTSELRAGPRELQAVYGGAPPDWDPSTSETVPYAVHADPAISTDLTGMVEGGTTPTPFAITVTNTGYGTTLDNAQVKVTIQRTIGGAPLGPLSGSPRLVLRHIVDGTPTPVVLTPSGQTLTGVIGTGETWDLAPGEEAVESLDLAVSTGMSPGPLRLTFSIVGDVAGTPVTLDTTSGEITVVQGERVATTITAGDPGDPPFFPAVPPVTPIVARQGGTLEVYNLNVVPDLSGVRPTGALRFSVDGRPVPVRVSNAAVYGSSVAANEAFTFAVMLPEDVATGTRQLEVRYAGDMLFEPSQTTFPVTVLPAVGPVYECRSQGIVQISFTVNVQVDATLPTVWPVGRDLPLTRVGLDLISSRTYHDQDIMLDVVGSGASNLVLEAGLGSAGSVTFGQFSQSNASPMFEDDGLGPDRTFSLRGGAGALSLDGAPGATTEVTLDQIEATTVNTLGFSAGVICTPSGDAAVLGTVTLAGTTLTVEPGTVVAEGGDVVLTASALPAGPGVVEFRDGASTIGVVPVDSLGAARMSTDDLAVGVRSLTARFFGGPVATLPSAPVELRVASCGAAAEPGNGAVVRLVYLELLGRCPDAAGYAFWVGLLDGGMTSEVFARTIARTPEAVGRVVDDAYRTMLGRPADAAGRAFWTGRLLAHGRYDQLLADLGASSEFWALAGSTNTGFVTRVYERLLDRSPEQAGLDYWVGRLGDGVSRRVLILTLANLDEPLGVLVTDSYGEILDRVPDAAERTAGIAHLRSTGDRSGLYAQLIGTGEFSTRAQGFPAS